MAAKRVSHWARGVDPASGGPAVAGGAAPEPSGAAWRLLAPSGVPQGERRRLLEVLASRGKVKPSTLGVSRAYFYQLRRGLRPIPDHILARLLELAGDDDLALVPYFAQYVDYSRVKAVDVDRMVRVIVEWAKANPASAGVLLGTLEVELERLGLTGGAVKVTEAHWRSGWPTLTRGGGLGPSATSSGRRTGSTSSGCWTPLGGCWRRAS